MALVTRRLPRSALRHLVTIERQNTDELDEHGQYGTWEEWKPRVPASIETLTGRQLENAQRTFAEATHRVQIDYIDGLTPRDRLVFGERTFYIGHLDDVDMARLVHSMLVVERT